VSKLVTAPAYAESQCTKNPTGLQAFDFIALSGCSNIRRFSVRTVSWITTELCVAFASTVTTRFSIHPVLCRIESRWVRRPRCGGVHPLASSVHSTFVRPRLHCQIIYHLVFTFRLCNMHISTLFRLPAKATKAWERGVNDSDEFSMIDNPKGASAHKLPFTYLPGDFSKSERMHIHNWASR
jgi:hypothetical protein